MDQGEINICKNHQDYQVPLIWTFKFPGAEYWCPYCGKVYGMFDDYKSVEKTGRLTELLEKYNEYAEKFLSGEESTYKPEHKIIFPIKSAIIVPHSPNCQALEWLKKGEVPIEWNVIDMRQVYCDDDAQELSTEQAIQRGRSETYYEMKCGDKICPGIKRVFAQAIAKI